MLKSLNPYALVLKTSHGKIDNNRILKTNRFDFERAIDSPGLRVKLREEVSSESDEYGIGSFVYRARRPFHPRRFWDAMHGDWPGLLRAKGFFGLATRLDRMGVWSQSGPIARLNGGDFWWADPISLPAIPESRPRRDAYLVVSTRVGVYRYQHAGARTSLYARWLFVNR